MSVEERIAAIVTPDFLEANADLDSIDDIYAAVAAQDETISRTEFEAFIKVASVYADGVSDELSENDLVEVAGGIGILAAAAAVAAVGGALGVCYKGGTKIGQALYYMTHRK